MGVEPEQWSAQETRKIRPLTRARARKLYEYLITYKMTHDGLSPGLQMICQQLDYGSTNTVEYHLALLERGGCIHRVKKHHGIRIKGGRWIPPQKLPEFTDPILGSIYRYILLYKRNNDGLSPPVQLIRHQSFERILSVPEIENALYALQQANQIIKVESGLRVIGATWTVDRYN